MNELKAFELKVGKNLETDSPLVVGVDNKLNSRIMSGEEVYLKFEADKVIADKDKEISELQAMLEERNRQIGELKDRIAPKQSDKPLQERLNEVCEKHGVSTLQDLDWALCESEKRRTRDCIEAAREINHHKFKRCLEKAELCRAKRDEIIARNPTLILNHPTEYLTRWENRWLELAEKFKEKK